MLKGGAMKDNAVKDGATRDGTVKNGAVKDGTVRNGVVTDGDIIDGIMKNGATTDVKDSAMKGRYCESRCCKGQYRTVKDNAVKVLCRRIRVL